MNKNMRSTLSVVVTLLLAASIYFINNYYLGWLLYGSSIAVIAILVIAVFSSGNGMPAGFIVPFLVLVYFGNMIIDSSDKDDGIIVNLELLDTSPKDDYVFIDTNIKAPSKIDE